MATNGRNRGLEPSYKQHAAVDDKLGVILDVEVTTARWTRASTSSSRSTELPI